MIGFIAKNFFLKELWAHASGASLIGWLARAGCRAPRESPYFESSNLEWVIWQVFAGEFGCCSVLGLGRPLLQIACIHCFTSPFPECSMTELKKKPIFMLSGYFDESGITASDKVCVIAGFMGGPSAMKRMKKKWNKALDDFGVSVPFHAIQFYAP